MNLNVPDISAVSRFFGGLWNELRRKRLWPIAAVLVAAIVAVPVLLSKSSHPAPLAQTPAPTPPPSAATSLPALNVETTQPHSNLKGAAHNPFGNSTSSSPTSTSVTSTASPASSPTVTGGAGTTPSGGSGSSTFPSASTLTTSGQGTGSNPPSITPNAKPKPAPTGLTATQSYDVSLAITTSGGGIDTIDPLTRLSLIPSDQQPLLVELGVEQGAKNVLFAVQPGTVVAGPGTCTPGPLDCEVLSLGQDQTEQLSASQGSLPPSQVALFAVTGITAIDDGSAVAANKARRAESAAGRAVLDKSTLPSLSLFQYEPSLGAVVDLRNLTVGVANAS